MRTYLLPLASLLLVAPAVYGGSSQPAAIDAKAAFDRLRSLAGKWEAKTDRGDFEVAYEVIAGGSAVVERTVVENMPMETVYYLDNSRLLLTHYCILGNQPRMEAREFNPATGELKFEFLDVTNLATPGAAHMHNVAFRFPDADHLTADWQLFENGRLKSTESFQFTRQRQ
ncbi:MAG: hypothetical protein LAP40_08245 [Acidobacteriia bacterium]|nr:hypothetical protein [Terriglobia bacterium]